MIFGNKLKQVLAFAIVLTGFYCFAQTQNMNQESNIYQDIYGNPLILHVNDTISVYFRENGEKVIAYYKGVEFNEEYNVLKEYLNEKYFNNHSYCHFYTEYFYILFDKNLEVVEVRILQRPIENVKYEYDSILVDALKNTTEMWHKTVENKEWYFMVFPYYPYHNYPTRSGHKVKPKKIKVRSHHENNNAE